MALGLQAISLSPNNPKLHTIRAYCYAMIEWYGEAVADYDVVLSLEPDNSHASYNRSIAMEKLGGAIDRAAAKLSTAASYNGGCGSSAAPDRAWLSTTSQGYGLNSSNDPGSISEQAVAAYEFTVGGSAVGAPVAGTAPAAGVTGRYGAGDGSNSCGGIQPRSVQGVPAPKLAWASVDSHYMLRHQLQQSQQLMPSASAAFRDPMRGGAQAASVTVTGRDTGNWGSSDPVASMAQAAFLHRASQVSAPGSGSMPDSQQLYFHQHQQAQQQHMQRQAQWYAVHGGPTGPVRMMGAGAGPGPATGTGAPASRARTPHRAVRVP